MALPTQQPDIYDPEESGKDHPKPSRSYEDRPTVAGSQRPLGSPRASNRDAPHRSRQPRHSHERPSRAEDKELSSLRGKNSQDDHTPRYTSNKDAEQSTEKRGNFFQRQKRKIIGIGIIGALFGGGYGIFLSLQPLQAIHFSQLLGDFHLSGNEESGNSRTARLVRWARYPENRELRRLGSIRNKFADGMEVKLNRLGVESMYDSRGYLDGYKLIGGNIDEAAAVAEVLRANDLPSEIGPHPRTGELAFDLTEARTGARRSTIRTLVELTGYNKIGAVIHSRNLIKRAGVTFSVFSNAKRTADERFFDFARRITKEAGERWKNGVEIPNLDDTDIDKGTAEDPPKTRLQKVKSSLSFKITAGSTAALSAACLLRGLGQNVDQLEHANVVLPLMRLSWDTIVAGNQVMAGENLNADELGAHLSRFSDEGTPELQEGEEGYVAPTSWMDSKSVQYELGQEPTGRDIPDAARLKESGNWVFRIVDRIPLLPTACNALETGAGQTFAFIIDAATGLGGAFLGEAFGQLFGDEVIDWASRKLAGEEINVDAAGADFGNFANHGARHAGNEEALAMGGRELSDTEVAELNQARDEQLHQYASERGLGYRLFALDNPYSLLSRAAVATPRPQALLAKALDVPDALRSGFAAISNSFVPKAGAAQTASEIYGFPKYGFSLAELDTGNESFDNPYANEEVLFQGHGNDEQRLKQLNDDWGEPCFGVTLSSTSSGNFTQAPSRPYSDIPPKCSDTSNDELLRFRLYILDNMMGAALACTEGDESLCSQFGIGAAASSGGGGTTNVNCSSAVGTEKILCAAREFEGLGYKNTGPGKFFGHPPDQWYEGFKSGDAAYQNLDCSGLTNVAIFRAFGEAVNMASPGYYTDDRFQKVDISQAKPGDIALMGGTSGSGNAGHAAIVESISGDDLRVYDSGGADPNEVGSSDGNWMKSRREFQIVRYIGPGVN